MSTGAKPKTTPIVLAALGAALTLFVFPVMFVVAASSARGPMSFLQEGGWGVWVIFLAMIVSVLASVGLGIWLTMRQTAWSWAYAVMPLMVALAGAGFEALGMTTVMGAVAGESVDPAFKALIVAVGTSEAAVLGILGGVAACSLFASAACVFGARAMSRVGSGGFGVGAIAALGAGLVGLGAVAALALLVEGFRGSSFGFGWFPALAMVVGAILGGVALSDKQAGDDAKGRALGDLLVASVYGTFGVLFASTIVHGSGFRTAMAAVGGESIDPSQRARIMTEGLRDMHAAFAWHLLFLLPVVLVVVAAAAPSLRHMGRALRSSWAGVLAPTVVGVIVLAMLIIPRGSRTATLVRMTAGARATDVELVVVPRASERPTGGGLVLGRSAVQIEGTRVVATSELSEARCKDVYEQFLRSARHRASITVDASTPWSRVACVLSGADSPSRLENRVLEFQVQTEGSSGLPEPWNALSQPVGGLGIVVSNRADARRPNHVHLSRDTWEARIGDKRETMAGSFDDRASALREKLSDVVGLTADPEVAFGDVLRLASTLRAEEVILEVATTKEAGLSSKPAGDGIGLGAVSPWGSDPADRGAGDTGRKRPIVRMGATTVNGRLPPEVIQRIVRQNYGRFRLCYESGLQRNPKLEGRVAVRFVIDRDGAVSDVASAGSDLPDAETVNCVTNAFRGLSFPQPEGGIVTVVYPIMFSPGE